MLIQWETIDKHEKNWNGSINIEVTNNETTIATVPMRYIGF